MFMIYWHRLKRRNKGQTPRKTEQTLRKKGQPQRNYEQQPRNYEQQPRRQNFRLGHQVGEPGDPEDPEDPEDPLHVQDPVVVLGLVVVVVQGLEDQEVRVLHPCPKKVVVRKRAAVVVVVEVGCWQPFKRANH